MSIQSGDVLAAHDYKATHDKPATEEKSIASASHLKVLDGLRGYMALWVWIGHCCIKAGAEVPGVENVGLPVEIFMFLSGFVMAWNHFLCDRSWTGGGSEITAFYIKRFFRLSPLYYMLMIPAILFLQPMKAATLVSAGENLSSVPAAIDIPIHLTYLYGLFPATASNNILPDWSLSLEMQFYAVFPFLVLVGRRLGDVTLLGFAVLAMYLTERVISLPGEQAHYQVLYYPVATLLTFNLPMFVVGMVAARFVRMGMREVGIGAVIGLGFAVGFHKDLLLAAIVGLTISALAGGQNVFVRTFSTATASRFGRVAGNWSYSIYLLHMIGVDTVQILVQGQAWYLGMNSYLKFLVLLILPAPFVIAASAATFRWIERPGVRLGNRIILLISRLSDKSLRRFGVAG